MKPLRDLTPYEDTPRGRAGGSAPANSIRRMPAGNPEQAFFHFDLLRALEMHRRLAGGIFLAALLLSAAYVARRWNTYKAESLVYVQPSPPHMLGSGQARDSWPFDANTYESYIQQQIHNVTRADVLAAAAKNIDELKGTVESDQAAADWLGGNLEVTRVSTGYQISIVATATSADEAAQMSNAVAHSFIDSATRELRSGDVERLDLLGEERDRVQKELARDRAEQDTLNKQLGVASVTSTPDTYDDQIAAIRTELVKARTDNDQAAAKLMATAGGGPSSAALDAAADQIVAADPGLVSMKTALNKRRSDLISQMANLTPSHPQYKQDSEELAKINTSLDAMSKELRAKASTQIEQTLKSDLERTSSVEARLNAQLGQLTSAAGSATPRMQRSNDLATDISRLQARFTTVDEQYRNLVMENAAPGAVYLSSAAVPPLHADHKKVFRNAAIVLLVGLVFALGAALIAHNLDPRIYIAADVERVLGFAPMAMLPDLHEVETGVAEEYLLRLAAAVEHAHQQGSLHSCIFTGVTAGAGTTTVSTRVNSMLQAMGRETMLVDAVGAPPPMENVNPGRELVYSPRGSRSTALLQQMNEEANDDTIVVTDTAPLLVSGETEYLARFVDSAIVVIESGVTTKAQLLEVAQTLERLDVAAAGFVLNRISLATANASFRQSVRAVEKHLKAQTRAFDRGRPRSRKLDEAPVEIPDRPPAPAYNWDAMPHPPANPEPGAPRAFEWTRSADARPAPQPAIAQEPSGTTWQTASAANSARAEAPAEPERTETRGLDWLEEEMLYAPAHETARPAENETGFDRQSQAEPPAVEAPAVAATPEPVDRGLPSFSRRTEETPQVDEGPQSGLPDYLRWTADEFQFPAATARPAETTSPAPAADDASLSLRNEGRTPPSVPARPKRGREGVRTKPDERPSAPAAQDASDAWHTAMKADAESQRILRQEEIQESAPEDSWPISDPPVQHTSPFADFNQPGEQPQPLQEWWSDPTPGAQPSASEAHAAGQAAGAQAEPATGKWDDVDESLARAATRLGGLRNLLVTLGIQHLHQGSEQRKAEFQAEQRQDRVPERAVYAQPVGRDGNGDHIDAEVTARPEIIPPHAIAAPVEREKLPKTPTKPPHVNRWDSPDDVDILPSRRGQYRRKH